MYITKMQLMNKLIKFHQSETYAIDEATKKAIMAAFKNIDTDEE